jgi:8-hydroxy-5-deazaflavin:NADPH oxidoreductase
MKIAFLGTGGMTHALASKWAAKHSLFFGGRSLDKAKALTDEFGGAGGSMEDAAAFGDVIVLALHAGAALEVVAHLGNAVFAGKTVIDITNPIDITTFRSAISGGASVTDALAKAIPDAHLGKAFNMAHTSVWAAPDLNIDGRPYVTLYTADDEASDIIATLITDAGSEPLLLGNNAHAYQLEAAAGIVIKFLFSGRDGNTVFQFIQPEFRSVR